MKTAKEKAKELIELFTFTCKECDYEDNAILCALMAANEVINNNSKIPANIHGLHTIENTDYWEEVKEEIIKPKK